MARSHSEPNRNRDSAKTSRPPDPKRGGHQKSQRTGKSDAKPARADRPSDATLFSLVSDAMRGQTFLKLVISNPLVKSSASMKVTVREIDLQGKSRFQWTVRNQSQELHENLSSSELIERLKTIFGTQFSDAHLFTSEADLTVRSLGGQSHRIKRKAPSQQSTQATSHNIQKRYLIPVGVPCAFLAEIGVMSADGQVRPSMYHKFRQINRYLEFVEDLMPHLPATGTINVVDFGCGKSYLTFALHHLLTVIHQREVSIIGLDLKEAVMEDCERIARTLNCRGLSFQVGRIENFTPASHVHLAVSLHACDTATDDALAAALRWESEAILAVPCCQHEVCQTMGTQTLPGLTRFGILKERFASLATDALRALFLDLNGYRTQVLEFIETEHTPKNLLIRAVRRQENPAAELSARQAEYDQLKTILGLSDWHFEQVTQQADAAK